MYKRQLFNNAPDLSGAIRKYIEENAGLKKQVEDFMKEKLLQNIQEVNGTKVIKFCAAMIPADTVKNIAFQLRFTNVDKAGNYCCVSLFLGFFKVYRTHDAGIADVNPVSYTHLTSFSSVKLMMPAVFFLSCNISS